MEDIDLEIEHQIHEPKYDQSKLITLSCYLNSRGYLEWMLKCLWFFPRTFHSHNFLFIFCGNKEYLRFFMPSNSIISFGWASKFAIRHVYACSVHLFFLLLKKKKKKQTFWLWILHVNFVQYTRHTATKEHRFEHFFLSLSLFITGFICFATLLPSHLTFTTRIFFTSNSPFTIASPFSSPSIYKAMPRAYYFWNLRTSSMA